MYILQTPCSMLHAPYYTLLYYTLLYYTILYHTNLYSPPTSQAGQGLNLGLGDAKALSEGLYENLAGGADLGAQRVLETYAKKRYVECLAMMGTVDVINSLFKSPDSHDLSASASPSGTGARKGEKNMNSNSNNTNNSNKSNVQNKQNKQREQGLAKAKVFVRSIGMLGIHAAPFLKSKIAGFAMQLQLNKNKNKK